MIINILAQRTLNFIVCVKENRRGDRDGVRRRSRLCLVPVSDRKHGPTHDVRARGSSPVTAHCGHQTQQQCVLHRHQHCFNIFFHPS